MKQGFMKLDEFFRGPIKLKLKGPYPASRMVLALVGYPCEDSFTDAHWVLVCVSKTHENYKARVHLPRNEFGVTPTVIRWAVAPRAPREFEMTIEDKDEHERQKNDETPKIKTCLKCGGFKDIAGACCSACRDLLMREKEMEREKEEAIRRQEETLRKQEENRKIEEEKERVRREQERRHPNVCPACKLGKPLKNSPLCDFCYASEVYTPRVVSEAGRGDNLPVGIHDMWEDDYSEDGDSDMERWEQ